MSVNLEIRYQMRTAASVMASVLMVSLLTAGPLHAKPPELSKKQVKLVAGLMSKGLAQLSKDDLKRAEKAYKKLVKIYAGNDTAVYNLACTYSRAKKKDLALATLAKAVDLGFTDVAHMKKDTDLDPIRSMKGFQEVLDHADDLAKKHGHDDPLALPEAAGKPAESLAAIEKSFRKEKRAGRLLRSVLGTYDREAHDFAMLRKELSAIAAYAAAHSEEKEAADGAALKAMGSAPYATATIRKAIDSYKETYKNSKAMAMALTMEARLAADALFLQKKYPEAKESKVKAAKEIVKLYPDAAGSRDAYFWLYDAANEAGREAEALTLYRKLKKHFPDDKEFWDRHGYEFFAAKIKDAGVPDFSVNGTKGETMSREAAKGKVTLVDFWATWCGPCRAEIPHLKTAYEKHHKEGFEIYGISADKKKDIKKKEFTAWVKEHKMPWPEFFEEEQDENRLLKVFGIYGFPTTLLLNRDGSVAAVNLRGEELEEKVAELLSAK